MAKGPKTEDGTSADDKFLQQILSTRVREIRRSLKLPQHELAAMIGSKQSFIFLVEAAEANVTLKTLARLAKALQVRPDDLLRLEPLPTIDDSKSRELAALVQISVQNLRLTISNLSKNTQDAAIIEESLKIIYELLVKFEQEPEKNGNEDSEASTTRDD